MDDKELILELGELKGSFNSAMSMLSQRLDSIQGDIKEQKISFQKFKDKESEEHIRINDFMSRAKLIIGVVVFLGSISATQAIGFIFSVFKNH